MPGISDSGQVDDIRVHLETIIAADNARQTAPDGETAAEAMVRESVRFRTALRERLEAALAEVTGQAPGLSAAEVAKLTGTRAGRDAVADGITALARVDDHLQSVTGERNPVIGKSYGVFGENPATFGAVLRSLSLSLEEDARLAALPADDPQRELLFTPVVSAAVTGAYAKMSGLLGARALARGDLARSHTVKQTSVEDALAAIAAARQHLYANLPDRKTDDSLYDYGFRPIHTGRRARRPAGEPTGDADNAADPTTATPDA